MSTIVPSGRWAYWIAVVPTPCTRCAGSTPPGDSYATDIRGEAWCWTCHVARVNADARPCTPADGHDA